MNKTEDSGKAVDDIEGEEVTVGSKYVYYENKKLGSGSFGEIFKGINVQTNEEVAVKIEFPKIKTPVLENESKILTILQGQVGFPKLYDYYDNYKNKYLIIEQLGITCEEIKEINGGTVPLKCVLMLALQMLDRLEWMHYKEILYRDIKPDNFLIGRGKYSNVIYLIDFGLCRKFIDPKTKNHIPFKEGKSLTGTVRYVSISTHLGYEQSRRDDLESLCYVLVYMLKGSLPWQGIKCKTKKEKYDKIGEKKQQYCPTDLCKGIQEEFYMFLKYSLNLGFEDKPDYNYLKNLFKNCFMRHDIDDDNVFNWKIGRLNKDEHRLVKKTSTLENNHEDHKD